MTWGRALLLVVYGLIVFYFGYREGFRDGGGGKW